MAGADLTCSFEAVGFDMVGARYETGVLVVILEVGELIVVAEIVGDGAGDSVANCNAVGLTVETAGARLEPTDLMVKVNLPSN